MPIVIFVIVAIVAVVFLIVFNISAASKRSGRKHRGRKPPVDIQETAGKAEGEAEKADGQAGKTAGEAGQEPGTDGLVAATARTGSEAVGTGIGSETEKAAGRGVGSRSGTAPGLDAKTNAGMEHGAEPIERFAVGAVLSDEPSPLGDPQLQQRVGDLLPAQSAVPKPSVPLEDSPNYRSVKALKKDLEYREALRAFTASPKRHGTPVHTEKSVSDREYRAALRNMTNRHDNEEPILKKER